MEIEMPQGKNQSNETKDKSKYGRVVYRIDDPKKFQNETPLILTEYQKRKVIRVNPINSSVTTSFVGGNTIDFVIKGHEYVNFRNSVIYATLSCACIPSGEADDVISLPFNSCSFIKRFQLFIGGGDPIENINEYGYKQSIISTLKQKTGRHSMMTLETSRPAAGGVGTRTMPCTAATTANSNSDRTMANGPTIPAGGFINQQFPIIIPLDFCLTESDYINLYNINDEGIRISLELDLPENTLLCDTCTAPIYWISSPKLELEVITTTTQNRLSKTPFTIRGKTFTQGSFLWGTTSSVNSNIQTHNVSVNSIIFALRAAAGIKTITAGKMRDAIHDDLADSPLINVTLGVDNDLYPFSRTLDTSQLKWMALKQYMKQYSMNQVGDDELFNDTKYLTQTADATAHTMSIFPFSLESWPQESEIIDGIGGRNSTINIAMEQKNGAPLTAVQLVTYFIGSDLLVTIEDGNVKTMNR